MAQEDTKAPANGPVSADAVAPAQQDQDKRSHKGLKLTLIVMAVLIGLALLVGGWFGLVPGLSSVLGATKPRDLGVRYTDADYQSLLAKSNAEFLAFAQAPDHPDKPGKKLIFANPTSVDDLQVSQEELTALVNEVGWEWMPLTNTQIKFSPGRVEVSGNINVEHIVDFIRFIGGVGYSDDDVSRAVDWGRRFVANPAVYIKASGSVSDDQLALQLQEVKVGRFTVPIDIAQKVITTGATNAITRADNLAVVAATATNGGASFTGTYPATTYVRR
jgi:hypothetical protein